MLVGGEGGGVEILISHKTSTGLRYIFAFNAILRSGTRRISGTRAINHALITIEEQIADAAAIYGMHVYTVTSGIHHATFKTAATEENHPDDFIDTINLSLYHWIHQALNNSREIYQRIGSIAA